MKKVWKLCLSLLLMLSIIPVVAFADDAGNDDDNNEVVYNFYATSGTLPTLYSGLHSFTNTDESYMWYQRKETFNSEYLPGHVNLIAPTKGYSAEVMDEIVDKVAELYQANPDAKFNFFIDDLRVQFILQVFVANGVPESNYEVYLLSDGTATYSYFNTLFKSDNSHSKWLQYADEYEDIAARVAASEPNVINVGNSMSMYTSMYYAAQKPNVRYWMQFPELLESLDANIVTEKEKMNTVKIAPSDIYNTLSDQNKLSFLKAAGVDIDYFDELFYATSKPNLIISGTSLAGEQNTFESVVNKIVSDFGNTYDLFFKPHPAWNPATNAQLKELKRMEFLDSHHITLLPAQLPMETLMWAYPDVKIGGYSSSLYMSTAQEQTIFFIADSKNHLAAPLPELYDLGHFGEANFYKITPDPEPEPEEPDDDSNASIRVIEIITGSSSIPATVTGTVYQATVPNNIDSVKLSIGTHNDTDVISVKQGDKAIAGSKADGLYQTDNVPLIVGENQFTITVNSSDDSLKKEYTLKITREAYTGGGAVIIPPSDPTRSEEIIFAGQSGRAQLGDAILIELPAGATDQAIRLSIQKLLDTAGLISDGDPLLSPIFEVLKNVPGNFSKPITISIKFDLTKLGDGQTASIFYYDEDEKVWVELGGVTDGNTVSVEVDHFTKFAVFAVDKKEQVEINLTDIKGHWAEEHIKQAIQLQIVEGYSDKTFRPDQSISREEFIVMLARALQLSKVDTLLPFTDKDNISPWAKEAITSAVSAGIVKGYDDGSLRPKTTINRAEMVTMIGRALELSVQDDAVTSFSDDKDIPRWAKGYVDVSVKQGIINGRGNNRFVPNGNATRAEVVVTLVRILESK